MTDNLKVTRLKTLKDLDNGFRVVGIRELKAEAIKWVKDRQCVEVHEFIINFFNITEEDLQ